MAPTKKHAFICTQGKSMLYIWSKKKHAYMIVTKKHAYCFVRQGVHMLQYPLARHQGMTSTPLYQSTPAEVTDRVRMLASLHEFTRMQALDMARSLLLYLDDFAGTDCAGYDPDAWACKKAVERLQVAENMMAL